MLFDQHSDYAASDRSYPRLGSKLLELREKFNMDRDLNQYETDLHNLADEIIASEIEQSLNEVLSDRYFLASLKVLAGEKAMRFRGYREVGVRLVSGLEVRVRSPYFCRNSRKKKGRKRKGRPPGNQPHCHLGLSVLGSIARCTGNLAGEVCKLAVLAPSFEVCRALLADRGIEIDPKTIHRICRILAEVTMEHRGRISFSGQEAWEGLTLVLGVDGGRLRERKTKRGRKKKGQKQQGYHTDWREPKLFTFYLTDEQGKTVKGFPPIHDATMGDKDRVFGLIRTYLKQIPLQQLKRIVFCGDGATWIWPRVQELFKATGLDLPTYQVIDFTHAKQALGRIWELLPRKLSSKEKQKIWKTWEEALWKGEIRRLGELIGAQFKTRNRAKCLKKWRTYFLENEHRMQYDSFAQLNLPCGSGCVESAIRRVINMRLKAPGTFWKKEMAEKFLFLRSQLISGRWNIMMKNIQKSLIDNWNACSTTDDEDFCQLVGWVA